MVVCCECGAGFCFGVLVGSVAGLWGASRGHSGGCWVALVGLGLILVSVVGWLVGGRG